MNCSSFIGVWSISSSDGLHFSTIFWLSSLYLEISILCFFATDATLQEDSYFSVATFPVGVATLPVGVVLADVTVHVSEWIKLLAVVAIGPVCMAGETMMPVDGVVAILPVGMPAEGGFGLLWASTGKAAEFLPLCGDPPNWAAMEATLLREQGRVTLWLLLGVCAVPDSHFRDKARTFRFPVSRRYDGCLFVCLFT